MVNTKYIALPLLNKPPRYKDLWDGGSIVPFILILGTRYKCVVTFMSRPRIPVDSLPRQQMKETLRGPYMQSEPIASYNRHHKQSKVSLILTSYLGSVKFVLYAVVL